MASKSGQVTLRGRFPKGTRVRLVKVADESVLRAGAGKTVAVKKVDDEGVVKFTTGVEVDARYFIVGQVDGTHLEVRARGRSADDDAEVLGQAPVGPDRIRRADGSWSDEPLKREKTPGREVGPAPGQHQVADNVPQRSSTLVGTAHPVDPAEPAPYPRQEDTNGAPQMSDTRTGRAAPIVPSLARQEDVPKGVQQRSDTPTGVATPIPQGDAVDVQRMKESADTKAARGTPGQAAASPAADTVPTPKRKTVSKPQRKQAAKKAAAGKLSSKPAPKSQVGKGDDNQHTVDPSKAKK